MKLTEYASSHNISVQEAKERYKKATNMAPPHHFTNLAEDIMRQMDDLLGEQRLNMLVLERCKNQTFVMACPVEGRKYKVAVRVPRNTWRILKAGHIIPVVTGKNAQGPYYDYCK